jgi:hypothetical protein
MLTWLVDFFDRWRQRRVEAHLRVHRAWFLSSPDQGECYFLNVQNTSPEREVTVTHIWIASEPSVHALAKELPVRIRPGAQWETWIPVDRVPSDAENVERLGRARLGDDSELRSVPRTDVPAAGYMPEG